MIETILVRINGNEFNGTPVIVLPSGFSISWSFTPSQVSQSGFEIRIGDSVINLGTNDFIANIFSIQSLDQGSQSFGFSPSSNISRNSEIYCQIQLKDQFNNLSFWKTFTLYVNPLPFVESASFNPVSSITSGILIDFIVPDSEISTKIKWYQNGVLQSYLDDSLVVPARNIEYGDSWSASIVPFDQLESGYIFNIDPIVIPSPVVSCSDLFIIPSFPNPDDILELQYTLRKNDIIESIGDNSLIRWYINGLEVEGSSGSKFARLKVVPGDVVYARVDSNWVGFSGETKTTNSVVIGPYNLQLKNLVINGVNNSNEIPYTLVNAMWSVDNYIKNTISKFSIIIGHSEGSDSVYSTFVPAELYSHTVPSSYLSKGVDYYISVAPVDLVGNTGRYQTIYFKTTGNPWSDNVSADKGYTILINLKCEKIEENDPEDVLSLSVYDGSNAYMVDFYTTYVLVHIDSQTKIKATVDNSVFRDYLISVKDKKIVIYVDGSIVSSYDNMTQVSNEKKLSLIPRGGHGDMKSTIAFIRISTSSAYHLNESLLSSLISFSEIIDLPNCTINDIEKTSDGVIVVAKDTSSIYSKLYKYDTSKLPYKLSVESIASAVFIASRVDSSPGLTAFAVSTNRGSCLFTGDPVMSWESSTNMSSLSNLYDNKWNTFTSSKENGITISDD